MQQPQRLSELTKTIRESQAYQAQNFWRAATAVCLGAITRVKPEIVLRRNWGDDAIKQRGSTTLTSTSSEPTFTGFFAATELLNILPASVAALLFERCLRLNFSGVNQILLPVVTTSPTPIFVAEGGNAAMVQPVLGTTLFGPTKKILFGAAVTNEIVKYAPDTALAIIRSTIIRAATTQLDSAVLDANGADTTRPAGLLNGVADLGATAGGGIAALTADLGKLCGAMSDAKIASTGAMFVMNGKDAVRARGLLSPQFAASYNIVESPAVSAGTIISIAPAGIVSGFGAAPDIEASTEGVAHFESATPGDITTTTVGQTVKSFWQSDLLGLKLRLQCCWGPLQAGCVQKVVTVTW
jgi:hypothetical protein